MGMLTVALGLLVVSLGCGVGQSDSQDASDGFTTDDVTTDAATTDSNTTDTFHPGCVAGGEDGATSMCLLPVQTPEYYVEQGLKYFDTLDLNADPKSVPSYSALVARWEWPPWLKLTGFERDQMTAIGDMLRQFDPSTVPVRDCRAFAVQPFSRCHVVMEYEGRPCPIYEEFTFNDQGEMTFIEAWSDLPGLLPTPNPLDRWAEGPLVHRLSTRMPGLGNATGMIALDSLAMAQAAVEDPDILDFVTRARDFWPTWYEDYTAAGPDLFQRGCGWPPPKAGRNGVP